MVTSTMSGEHSPSPAGVDPGRLQRFTAAVCARAGSPADVADVVAEHLVRANLSGHDSHGVARLPGYVDLIDDGVLDPGARPAILNARNSTALFDARSGFGLYSTRVALDWAIEAARAHGSATAAIRHSQHIGRLGEYAERAAASGMIGIITVGMAGDGVGAMVLPGTSHRFFGANPWAFGVPAGDRGPVLVDVSTAVVAEGKVQVAAALGQVLPPGWIVDAQGRPSTDPQAYFDGGGLLPLGEPTAGHKGYGLGLASALVSGLAVIDDQQPTLVGAQQAAGADPRGRVAGVLVMVLDPAAFGDQAAYADRVGDTVDAIHRAATGGPPVIVPGEPERAARAERGIGIQLPHTTRAALDRLGRRFSLDPVT